MLGKTLLALGLGISTLGVQAIPKYENYSYTQLQQELQRLVPLTDVNLIMINFNLNILKKLHNGRQANAKEFLELSSYILFSYFNENYTLNGNTYRADPRIIDIVKLFDTCYHLTKYIQSYDELTVHCKSALLIYLIADFDPDALLTIATYGSIVDAQLKQSKNEPLSNKELALIGLLNKYVGSIDFGFTFKLPPFSVYYDKKRNEVFKESYNVDLVPDQ
ncbi:hypothetical protein CJP74_01770 [Psittacicella melopsittaci]|uniref:Uncharacterized protein n=1 Tax=Psittacicella melopsittaci TaxID=2028576 RepID=A0A3A1Y8E1_9GAMM|nr:hypothetical protein [Psittacicella melopsittaci]RIY33478.1 hypothetical protein CJP74_01770 [Psittacicella melopsittaci]